MLWWTLRQLGSTDAGRQVQAAEKLGYERNVKAVEPLISALKDSEKNVRVAAANALGKIGEGKAVQPLVNVLSDHDADVRRATADALKSLRYEPADDAQRAVLFVAGQEWDKAATLGAAAARPLAVALKDHDWRVRQESLAALVKIGGSGAVESLIAALKSCENTRPDWAKALGKIGDSRAVEPLITTLKDSNLFVRREAAEALGAIRDPRAVEPLIGALKDSEESVRRAARWSLSYIGTQEAESAVLEYLQPGEITTGKSLSGTRHRVSTYESKAGRAGECRNCKAMIKLVDAKEVCLDWDGVDAYHFYCPQCYKGTRDPHYYTGQLIGSDGNAVIDQHSWEYER